MSTRTKSLSWTFYTHLRVSTAAGMRVSSCTSISPPNTALQLLIQNQFTAVMGTKLGSFGCWDARPWLKFARLTQCMQRAIAVS